MISTLEYMQLAINEAKKVNNDVPVGAIIVYNNNIIASAHNEKEINNDITAHAEILAIKRASKRLGNWRLTDAKLFVTLEPCPMCAAAIINSRISEVFFGTYDTQYGAFGSVIDLRTIMPSSLSVTGGIREIETRELLDNFFKAIRL